MFQSMKQVEDYFIKRKTLGIKPGLDRVEHLLAKVDHPEKKINGIHVAGTNGKGSTILMIHDVLVEEQYRVGVFTSPSFSGLTGHFSINGKQINELDLLHVLNELSPYIDALDDTGDHPTEFEILTVIGLMYFVGRTDIVIVEAGMGGRYDTTNCFIPMISVITSIAYDHMQFLGDSIEEIATHKAGIMKRGQPLVIGKVEEKAREIILKEAMELSVPTFTYGKEFYLDHDVVSIPSQQLAYDVQGMALKGRHQRENASVALMVLTLLKEAGFDLQKETVLHGIKTTTLPGRLENIHEKPTIILDSAHNVAGAEALVEAMIAMKIQGNKQLLFAGFYDKQLVEMIEVLRAQFDDICLTTFEHERAATQKMLQHQFAHDTFVSDWKEEVNNMMHDRMDTTYFVTGSLDFITKVRDHIIQQKNKHYR